MTLSLEERVEIADQMGARLDLSDWQGEEKQQELSSFLDELDVPRDDNDNY